MRESRLQFTDQERNDPIMGKAVREAEKAAARADKAQSKIPRKKVVKPELKTDNSNGKIKVQLHFEDTEKKPPSRLNVTDVPAAAVRRQYHRQMAEAEDDNIGVEAADQLPRVRKEPGIFSGKLTTRPSFSPTGLLTGLSGN